VSANALDVKNIDACFVTHKATLLQVKIIQHKIYWALCQSAHLHKGQWILCQTSVSANVMDVKNFDN